MPNYKILLIFILVFLLGCALNSKKDADDLFYKNSSDELIISDVEKIYSTDFPKQLRKTLNFYSHFDVDDQKDFEKIEGLAKIVKIESHLHAGGYTASFDDMRNYIKIFSEKFFIYEIEKYENENYRISAFIGDARERVKFYVNKKGGKYAMHEIYWENMTDWFGFEYIDLEIYKKYWI